MNKKNIVLILAAAIISLPFNLFGATVTVKGIHYDISETTDSVNVVGRQSHSRRVVIPKTIRSNGKKYTVSKISDGAFENDINLYRLKLGKNIKSIGYRAFYGCKNLRRIRFNDSLSYLSYGVFEGTEWIERQKPGVVYCGKVAYTYKSYEVEPSSVSIRPGTVSIAVGCFIPAKELKNVELSESLVEICAQAFEETNIESIIVPKGVISIGELAFNYCRHLKKVIIQGCRSIGMSAFYCCESLQDISLPDNLEEIGQLAFRDCIKLKTIEIPAGVNIIRGSSFFNCRSLVEVKLNDGLEEIDVAAFWDCESLESITIPATVNRVAMTSFNYPCTLKTVVIHSVIPPALSKDAFPNSNESIFSQIIKTYWSCSEGRILYVPAGSIDKYRNAEGWNHFDTIRDLSEQ